MESAVLNEHNKKEYPPMHTVEHILNATMVKLMGCQRSHNAHIERKKSKCDYYLNEAPTADKIQEIEDKVNEIIDRHLEVKAAFLTKNEAKKVIDISRLPDEASDTIRIVSIGDYDYCACIGAHVDNTAEIGKFKITTHNFDESKNLLRLRFKLLEK